jgi:hypothetical protein
MDLIKSLAYMTLWGVGFIAVDALTHPFFNTMQGWISGKAATNTNGGN